MRPWPAFLTVGNTFFTLDTKRLRRKNQQNLVANEGGAEAKQRCGPNHGQQWKAPVWGKDSP